MEKINMIFTREEDIERTGVIVDKINEIIDWINKQESKTASNERICGKTLNITPNQIAFMLCKIAGNLLAIHGLCRNDEFFGKLINAKIEIYEAIKIVKSLPNE
jgi:hypothetical protein